MDWRYCSRGRAPECLLCKGKALSYKKTRKREEEEKQQHGAGHDSALL
jgi:hypothetical protein